MGWVILTSKKVRSNGDHKPVATISKRAIIIIINSTADTANEFQKLSK